MDKKGDRGDSVLQIDLCFLSLTVIQPLHLYCTADGQISHDYILV